MVLMTPHDPVLVCSKRKDITGRPITWNQMSKIGNEYKLTVGFYTYFAIVELKDIWICEDIRDITNVTARRLGYKDKHTYLAQPYNLNNPDFRRKMHEFELVENNLMNFMKEYTKVKK